MTRGMSFNKGIFFIGKKYISCVHYVKEKEESWILPINFFSLSKVLRLILFSMPAWYYIVLLFLIMFIYIPPLFQLYCLPEYILIYFAFGTHFWFPYELRKFHGAEHKVFNYRGTISLINKMEIKKEPLTNRYCSTNGVTIYFLLVLILFLNIFLFAEKNWNESLRDASYFSVFLFPFFTFVINRKNNTFVHKWVLRLSYLLQEHITTKEPEDKHLKVAIRAYRNLAAKEFPHRIQFKRKKVVKKMAIVDITVIPIGTETTSISLFVSEIHRLLKETDKKITYELTPMSTIIEGELDDLLEIVREIHEVPFKLGVNRVTTNIRIDDRRDKLSSMRRKVDSVEEKLEKMKESEGEDNE